MGRKRQPVLISLSKERHEILCHLASSTGLSADDYALALVERHMTRKLKKWEREHEIYGDASLDELLLEPSPPLRVRMPSGTGQKKVSGRKKNRHIDFAAITRRSRPGAKNPAAVDADKVCAPRVAR